MEQRRPGFTIEGHADKIFFSAVLVFVSIRLILFNLYPAPEPGGDAAAYLALSKLRVLSSRFLVGERPPGYLLFLKVVSGHSSAIYWTQFLISCAVAILFMRVVYRLLQQTYLKVLSLVVLSIFFLNPAILIWDKWIITESLSLSVFVLIFALLMTMRKEPRVHELTALAALWIYFGLLRDGNLYLMLLFALYAGLASAIRLLDRRYLLVCVPLLLTFLYSNHAINMNQRYSINLINVISLRILPDNDRLAFFQGSGMPVSPELLERKGRQAGDHYEDLFSKEPLVRFRSWVLSAGKDTFVSYLVRHPIYLFWVPVTTSGPYVGRTHKAVADLSIRDLYETQMDQGYLLEFVKVPNSIRRYLWPAISFLPLAAFYVAACCFLAAVALRRSTTPAPHVFAVLFFIVSSYPFMLVLWHSDAWDVWRHLLPALISFNLGIILSVLFLLDRLFPSRRAEQQPLQY